MKKINKLITILFVGLVTFSCTDLTEEVYDKLTAEEYYKNFSESDIPAAIGPAYSQMRNLFAGYGAHTGGCWLWTSEETSDIWITPKRGGAWYDGGIYYRLNQHKWGVDDDHMVGNWRIFYNGVNTCNRLIFQFENAEIDNKEKVLAELRVARAFWYYNLCDFYGNVPLVTKYDVPEGFLPSTNSRKEVYDFVVSELTESIPFLDETGYAKWNKFSASSLLAKTYINSEAWGQAPAWDQVVQLCDQIIASGKYELESNYGDCFVEHNEGSSEIVMAIPNDEKLHSSSPFLILPWSHHWKNRYHFETNTWGWGGFCCTPSFIDTYDPDDKRLTSTWMWGQLYDNSGGFSGVKGSKLYCDPWNPRDNGKLLIYTKDFVFDPDGITVGEADGARLIKYEIVKGAEEGLENDFVLFRYADVFFMKAEALWRKNGKVATQEVVGLINTVRARAFNNFSGDKVLTPAMLTEDRFLEEYGWEFAAEGYRRQQLIRFGKFTTASWTLHEPSQAYRKLFPIPYKELLANPNLVQNEGY